MSSEPVYLIAPIAWLFDVNVGIVGICQVETNIELLSRLYMSAYISTHIYVWLFSSSRPQWKQEASGRGSGHVVSVFILTAVSLWICRQLWNLVLLLVGGTHAGNVIRDLFNQPVDYFALQTACDELDMR